MIAGVGGRPSLWSFPMLAEGVRAEDRLRAEHLEAFSEHNEQSVQASVWNFTAKSWVAPFEPVDGIEQGERDPGECTEGDMRNASIPELPPVPHKQPRSRSALRPDSASEELLTQERCRM